MSRVLLLSTRFFDGMYHGSSDGFSGNDGWPPSPSRLFQAFVVASAIGEKITPEDSAALKWFETLDPPRIVAPTVRKGRKRTLFVPNNDLDSQKGDPEKVSNIRVSKDWLPYYFDVNHPILYVFKWDDDSGLARARHICNIARNIYQLGKGIDMAYVNGEVLDENDANQMLEDHPGLLYEPSAGGNVSVPTLGTFDSLITRYTGTRYRLQTVGEGRKSTREFTQPSKARFRRVGYGLKKNYLLFELRNDNGRFYPKSLSLAAQVITSIRDKAADRLINAYMPSDAALIERIIKGVNASAPDLMKRVRIIPIPSIGSRYVEPLIRRIAIEIPPECPIDLEDLRWAFSGIQYQDERTGEATPGRLISVDSDSMFSRFQVAEAEFSSITPLALPIPAGQRSGPDNAITGRQRMDRDDMARSALIQALRHEGIHAKPKELLIQREPFDERGVRAELFARGTRFANPVMWHASITFDTPVEGPLVIGNGRYLGLGLMKPRSSVPQVIAFSIQSGLSQGADARTVVEATRRAMMARYQDKIGRNQKLPLYISGHLDDGSPSNDVSHAHIAVLADLPRSRILILSPHLLRRGDLRWDSSIRRKQNDLYQAVREMDVLFTGKAGRLHLTLSDLDFDTDPVLGSSRIWENVTEYEVTRHPRHVEVERTLVTDLVTELKRCKIGSPSAIDVLEIKQGRRGGISGKFRLTFNKSVKGPLLLGRSAHKGGGLFARKHID